MVTSHAYDYMAMCMFSWALCVLVVAATNTYSHIHEITAEKKKATGEKGPATALELGTYALRSIAEFQPRERQRPVLFPLSPVAFSF